MNNIVNIIDINYNSLGQIDEYQSLILSKDYNGVSGFELHLNEEINYADKLIKENIIYTSANKAYIILYRKIDSISGKLLIKGKELKSYLNRWLVFPPIGQAYYTVNSNIETIMKEYVTATLTRKGITNIDVAINQNRGMTTVYQCRYKNLSDELEKLCLVSGLGWDITLDLENKRFIFDVLEGQNRTADQDILPPAIFSIEYDNVAEQTLIDSKLDYANVAIVAGQGEGIDRSIAIVGDSEGFNSFELFVDARDLENYDYLPLRGQQKLNEVDEIMTFDSHVFADGNLTYERDFNLGDMVTTQNTKWDIILNTRISKITEIYENNGFRLDIIFGNNIPTPIERIKQLMDSPIVEGGGNNELDAPGLDGKGLDFIWDGTKLGVKKEGESTYIYTELKANDGYTPIKNTDYFDGLDGKSLEFHWNGKELGVRVEGQSTYQYVNLEGQQGVPGYTPVKGIDYFDGQQGLPGTTTWDGITNKPNTFPPDAHSHTKTEVGLESVQDYAIATQAEAEMGTVNNKYTTPLRVKEAINKAMETMGSGGTLIITSATEPGGLSTGDQWHKEY